MNDGVDTQQRIIDHLIVPYAKGDFHEDFLLEHAGGRLSVYLNKDLVKICPVNNTSLWCRSAAPGRAARLAARAEAGSQGLYNKG